MEYKVSWAAATGRHHRQDNVPCQDHVTVLRDDEVVCCALADGAGSRNNSHLGAQCVTQTVAHQMIHRFEALWELDHAALAAEVISSCVQALGRLEPPIYELASTLLFCAAHRDGRFLAGHLGDGVMVLEQSHTLTVFSPPENGEYQNETYFITGPDAQQHLRLRRGTWMEPGTLLLMSDGTADSLYHYADGTPAPACQTLAGWLRDGEEAVISQAIRDNLEGPFARRTSDDMSLIVLNWQDGGDGWEPAATADRDEEEFPRREEGEEDGREFDESL